MNYWTLIYTILFAIYVLIGLIFSYVMLFYKAQMLKHKKSSRLLIANKNTALGLAVNRLEEHGISVSFSKFDFENERINIINDNRQFYIEKLNEGFNEISKKTDLLKDDNSKKYIQDLLSAIEDSDDNYRRIVMAHNKIVKNYNYNAKSLVFAFFVALFNFELKEEI